jgi:hypothetical protein
MLGMTSQQGVGAVLGGRFTLTRFIGSGERGAVYEARDEKLGLDLALRVLPPALAQEPALLESRRVTHPNVCRVFDVQRSDGVSYVTMELVRGQRLKDVLNAERLSMRKAGQIWRQVCLAVEAAHREGVVHGYLRSAKVMVEPSGRVKVMDFGVNHAVEQSDATTGCRRPTEPAPPTTAPDVHSLGVIGYRLFTGRKLSRSLGRADLLLELPPRYQPVIRRCLSPDPGNRFLDAGEVRVALDRIRSSPVHRFFGWADHPVAAVGATLAGFALGWMALAHHPEKPARPLTVALEAPLLTPVQVPAPAPAPAPAAAPPVARLDRSSAPRPVAHHRPAHRGTRMASAINRTDIPVFE